MYAVTFDIDTFFLGNEYHTPSSTNAYGDIRKFMEFNGFDWQQGSVYFGHKEMTAVKCVITIQKLAKLYPWFSACAKDVRIQSMGARSARTNNRDGNQWEWNKRYRKSTQDK